MKVFQILLGRKNNVVFCQNLIFGIAESGQIVGVHGVHKTVDDTLCFGVGLHVGGQGQQPVVGHLPASVGFLRQRKLAQVFAVLAAGYHIGVAVQDRLLDFGVGVAA